MTISYRKALEALSPYPPGKPAEEVQREFGLERVVKLASNENPWGPSPLALEAIAREAKELHLYPESGCHYLRQTLAERLGIPADWLLFGNGSDEVVALLTAAYLEPGTNIVTSDPSFIRYEMGAQAMGAETRRVPMKNWRHDLDGLAAAVDKETRFVFFANPDNPVGTAVDAAAVERFLEKVPEDVVVVIDEAYYEFARDWSAYPRSIEYAKARPNVAVMRTFSKAYGLAGLRVGYGVARPELWDGVDRIRPPFNVNRLAQAAATAALDDEDHLKRTIEGNAAGRAWLSEELRRRGFEPVEPSLANFLLVDMKQPAAALFDQLLRQGAIVRPMGMYHLPQHLRISIGLPEENEFFIEALDRVINAASRTNLESVV